MNVVITGASAGIGRATARAFAARGARIGLIARNAEALEAARAEVEARGGQGIVAIADVADADAVERAAQTIEDAFGPIDVWVNNAMTSVLGRIVDITPDEFRRVTEVTYLGVVYGTLAALKRMQPHNRGVIVQVGSTLAYRGIPLQAPYCAAKHAIQGFHDSLLCELRHDRSKVRVCMVHLPAINTPQFRWIRNHMPRKPRPFGTIYEPEVAAEAIVRASENPKREVNVSWGTTRAIIANSFIPGLLDRYLGHIGFNGQQSDEREPESRADNLYAPVPGDAGVHGVFSDEAKSR
ncbi:MAG TPA: SDR family oxidoreductase [Thermoanaerobaculia bacterium]|jgi:NAD(P)-dependent dehydrogenase (short-subunit alcohol dehydrogenase family)|nr:SDR family oxidoreductase [Thermoanaerobaculia bacterium]